MEFIERFKIHIHDEPHLSVDVRMAKLKMHVTGKTERTISGIVSQGIMHETVLKTIKEQFGQLSVVARAYITKLTDKQKIQDNYRQALQELFFDVVNCVAALKQIVHLADENTTENLRKAVMRMPHHLVNGKMLHLTLEKKERTRPLNILPSSFEMVSKPNLIRSFKTFRIPIHGGKMVFSQVKRTKTTL